MAAVPVIVVSPHYDDAVLAVGQTMMERPDRPLLVVTVMGGTPHPYPPLWARPHDARCGFGPEDDVLAVRRAEDRTALVGLGGRSLGLRFVDSGYGPRVDVDEARAAITATVEEAVDRDGPQDVYVPLGLGHADHVVTRAAADPLATYVYAEAGYRITHDYDLAAELALLDAQGRLGEEIVVPVDAGRKGVLVGCYESQLRGLMGVSVADALTAPERIWRLNR